MKKLSLLLFIPLLMFAFACKKEGKGGKINLTANVSHHNLPIENASVYIKYGATEFPGSDLTVYDDFIASDKNGVAVFKGLRKGNYFLYSVGFDKSINENVTGGIPVKIETKAGDIAVPLPVTEDHG